MNEPAQSRSRVWTWYVCGLLLLATTINYMDRQTLSNAAPRVKAELNLSNEQYGQLEEQFAYAFGLGALAFGALADRVGVRFLYPTVLLLWSAMGFATGFMETFGGLLLCRTLLGLFESGHWPCALKTVQRLLPPKDRTMGNSILQSGTSIGAIATPQIMKWLMTDEPGSWRFVFQLIGLIGAFWIVLWFAAVREEPAGDPATSPTSTPLMPPLPRSVFVRRLSVLVVVVFCINACWHMFRAWLPLFLQSGRGYSTEASLNITSGFYIATDIGCILAGAATLWLHRAGMPVLRARWSVFLICSLMTLSSVGIAMSPAGWELVTLLFVFGAGALGLFPCYYALSQELTIRHQGKLSGLLGAVAWFTVAPIHRYFGAYIDKHQNFDLGIGAAGCLPLVACLYWLIFWGRDTAETDTAGS